MASLTMKITKKHKVNVCVFCEEILTGYPNNSEPLREGNCCNNCISHQI